MRPVSPDSKACPENLACLGRPEDKGSKESPELREWTENKEKSDCRESREREETPVSGWRDPEERNEDPSVHQDPQVLELMVPLECKV